MSRKERATRATTAILYRTPQRLLRGRLSSGDRVKFVAH